MTIQLKKNGPFDKDYHIYHKYLDRQARANSVDPDKMPQNVVSDLGLHCLPLIQQIQMPSTCSRMDLFIFLDKYGV